MILMNISKFIGFLNQISIDNYVKRQKKWKKKKKEFRRFVAILLEQSRELVIMEEWNMFNLTWKRAGDKHRHLYMFIARHLSTLIKI